MMKATPCSPRKSKSSRKAEVKEDQGDEDRRKVMMKNQMRLLPWPKRRSTEMEKEDQLVKEDQEDEDRTKAMTKNQMTMKSFSPRRRIMDVAQDQIEDPVDKDRTKVTTKSQPMMMSFSPKRRITDVVQDQIEDPVDKDRTVVTTKSQLMMKSLSPKRRHTETPIPVVQREDQTEDQEGQEKVKAMSRNLMTMSLSPKWLQRNKSNT